ncbi:hypothetical protein HNR46_000937 [Haloferula luteola]|uniref:Uncharacterized protein n=1 Tax=Haloferula luteola TaxID=595692 RepID=A0A840VAA0_9BACT|nr:hypothetical protein [Haloferula luteola]MBB5350709.1 hypothetical protein [Haloferula luteola]
MLHQVLTSLLSLFQPAKGAEKGGILHAVVNGGGERHRKKTFGC